MSSSTYKDIDNRQTSFDIQTNYFREYPQKTGEYLDNKLKIVFYLWISHGENVSARLKHYPITTKHPGITFFSSPYKPEVLGTMQHIIQQNNKMLMSFEVCDLINGNCPHVSVPIVGNVDERVVYMPPIVFSDHNIQNKSLSTHDPNTNTEFITDDGIMTSIMGLYRLEVYKYPRLRNIGLYWSHQCRILKSEKIMNNDDIRALRDDGVVTYSQILQKIKNECKKRGDNPAKIPITIFSCQTMSDNRYMQEYQPSNYPIQNAEIVELVAEKEKSLPQTEENVYPTFEGNFFYRGVREVKKVGANMFILNYDTNVFSKKILNWRSLLNIKHQGCGLNVLTFYDIIPQYTAREKAACLNLDGTNVFEILDILKQKLNKNSKMFVIRYLLQNGIHGAIDILQKYTVPPSKTAFTIVKLYKSLMQPNNPSKFNERGHTISLIKDDSNNIHIVDPQTKMKSQLTNVNDILNLYHDMLYVDIFFYTDKDTNQVTEASLQNDINMQAAYYRPRTHQYLGGDNTPLRLSSSKSRKSMKTHRSRKNTRSNSYSQTRRRSPTKTMRKTPSIRKSLKQTPNNTRELDAFEKLMLESDKKNNIPSALVIQ